MSKDASRPKLLDVARHARVSPSTVSRVIHHTTPVRENIRARVLSSMTALGYAMPRAGFDTLHNIVAVLIPDISNPFFPEIVRGIQDESGDDFGMLLIDTIESAQREEKFFHTFVNRAMCGVIVCGSRLAPEQLAALHRRSEIPMVVINRWVNDPQIPCVLVDFENSTYRATRHLLDLGHTRIAYLAGPVNSMPSQSRKRGIENALTEAGLTLRAEMFVPSFPSVDGGFQAMTVLLALGANERPTGVIAYDDTVALGALHAIRAHHLRVPEDISIIGFDDIAMAAHANPPLTTIAQPKYRLGKTAMKLLRGMIEGQTNLGDGYTLMESPLIVRESTALCIHAHNGNEK